MCLRTSFESKKFLSKFWLSDNFGDFFTSEHTHAMCFDGVSFLCCSFSDFQLQRFTTWKKATKGDLVLKILGFKTDTEKNRNTGNFCAKSLKVLTKHSQFFEYLSKKHVDFTEKLINKLSFAKSLKKVSHGVFTEFVYKFYGAIVKLRGRTLLVCAPRDFLRKCWKLYYIGTHRFHGKKVTF